MMTRWTEALHVLISESLPDHLRPTERGVRLQKALLWQGHRGTAPGARYIVRAQPRTQASRCTIMHNLSIRSIYL